MHNTLVQYVMIILDWIGTFAFALSGGLLAVANAKRTRKANAIGFKKTSGDIGRMRPNFGSLP